MLDREVFINELVSIDSSKKLFYKMILFYVKERLFGSFDSSDRSFPPYSFRSYDVDELGSYIAKIYFSFSSYEEMLAFITNGVYERLFGSSNSAEWFFSPYS